MKNTFTFLLLLTAQIIIGQTISFSDSQLLTKLLSASPENNVAINLEGQPIRIDTDLNGSIEISEAVLIRELNLNASSITNLDGLQFFTSLQNLNCSSNQLTSLVLPSFSSLVFLDCSINQLTSLDISLNPGITYLNARQNQLQSIIFPESSALNYLQLNQNQLNNLDVSSLTSLTILLVNENQLNSLNINGLTQLISLQCQYNQLTTLNLSGLSNLAGVSCEVNQLQNIQLEGLSSLTHLECYENQLTSIDVSDSPLLEILLCFQNELVDLNLKNGAQESVEFSSNPNLSYICADESQIDEIIFLTNDWGIPNCTVDSNCSLSIPALSAKENIKIAPHPIQEEFSIQSILPIERVMLWDVYGRNLSIMLQSKNETYTLRVPSGMYILEISTNEGIFTQKIIKQ
ncbi:T9SS type A sorting domain-containing protein [Flavobacterium sp.]|uniref:T9SS type A sorting domain-containing protein n=1 Tax=Flavobacterium sp. TaxID=239 RepID=UPI0039E525B0